MKCYALHYSITVFIYDINITSKFILYIYYCTTLYAPDAILAVWSIYPGICISASRMLSFRCDSVMTAHMQFDSITISAMDGTLLSSAFLYRHRILINNIAFEVALRMLCPDSVCFFGFGLMLFVVDDFPSIVLAVEVVFGG